MGTNEIWAAAAAIVSLILTVAAMPRIISYFRREQLGQVTREEGPAWHAVKSGTPTMGGVGFLLASVAATIAVSWISDTLTMRTWMLVFIVGLYGVLGFLDDYIKLVMKRNLGLTSRQKFMGQVLGGILFMLVHQWAGFSTELYLPFIGTINSVWLYGIFAVIWLVGFSNAVNLTDGLDGLVAGTGTIAYVAYAAIAWIQSDWDIVIFAVSVTGGLIGFFMFNKKPAQIFMGDVGSLALGGGLAAMSLLLSQEWSLLLIGLIFVIETASVILQVGSVKLRNKRIFKMSPIHHHFEMSGWSEWRVVLTFWAVGLIAAVGTFFFL